MVPVRTALVSLVLLFASPGLALDFAVTVTTDGIDANPGDGVCNDGGGQCPLRAAIQEANAWPGPDTVTVPAGVYPLTLKRDKKENDENTGDLDVTSGITLTGAGSGGPCNGIASTCIDGKNGKDRVFDVHPGSDLALQGVIVRNGKAVKQDRNPTQKKQTSGGCIRVDGSLLLEDSVVSGCSSPDGGGCIGFDDGSTGFVQDTFLDGCKTKDSGGGIEVDVAMLTLDRVTIANCSAKQGGGVETTSGQLDLRNLTLSRNKAKRGGGLAVEGEAGVSVNNATFFENQAKSGASVFADAKSQTTPVEVSNSLLQAGSKQTNCLGPVQSVGGNVEDGSSCDPLPVIDCPDCNPSLDPDLTDNGGAVPTHALDPDSDAIDGGLDQSCETTDARGAARVDVCDSGAFEFDGVVP